MIHILTIKAFILRIYWSIRSLNIYRISGVAVLGLSLQTLSNAMMPGSHKALLTASLAFFVIGSKLIMTKK
jgi:hypothetical protein